jgi:hypothetical protein
VGLFQVPCTVRVNIVAEALPSAIVLPDGYKGTEIISYRTSFLVFVPSRDKLKPTAVTLNLKNSEHHSRSISLQNSYNGIWLSDDVKVNAASQYNYYVQYEGKGKFFSYDKDPLVEEKNKRKVTSYAVHMDIFCGKSMKPEEICNGTKMFCEMMLRCINSDDDLQSMLTLFNQSEEHKLNSDGKVSVAKHIIDSFSRSVSGFRPPFVVPRAAFLVFLFSVLLTESHSWKKISITQLEAKSVLEGIQRSSLDRLLMPYVEVKQLTSTLTNLLRCLDQNASWLFFVYYCFPALPYEEVSKQSELFKEDYSNGKFCAEVVTHIWECDTSPEAESIILDIFYKAHMSVELIRVYKTLTVSNCERITEISNCINEKLDDYLKRCTGNQCLSDVLNYSAAVYDADECMYHKLIENFEEAVIRLCREVSFTASNHALLSKIIQQPLLFTGSKTFHLAEIASQSTSFAVHSLFPCFLAREEFMSSNTDKELTGLIVSWLSAFSRISTTEMDLNSTFDYLWQFVDLSFLSTDKGLQSIVNDKVLETSLLVAPALLDSVTVRNIGQLEKFINKYGKTIHPVRHGIAKTLVSLIGKSDEWHVDDTTVAKLRRFIEMDDPPIFEDTTMSLELLQALARSQCRAIHSLFLGSLNKFLTRLESGDAEKLIESWFSSLCKILAEKTTLSTAEDPSIEDFIRVFTARRPVTKEMLYLIRLYKRSYQAISTDCLKKNENLAKRLLEMTKSCCRKHARCYDELWHMCDSNGEDEAMALLKRHICEIHAETLPSLQEVLQNVEKRIVKPSVRQVFFNL